jgi:hypothetical protein
MMYLALGILIRPDEYPGLVGQVMIWILYGATIYLFSRSQKNPAPVQEGAEVQSWSPKSWLLLAGIFPVAATLGEILGGRYFGPLAVIFWLGGIIFGSAMFIQALRLTFPQQGTPQQTEV